MRLSHQKVFNILCEKYGLTYAQGMGGMYPKNFFYFKKGEHDFMNIELIPAGKYLKTIYVMILCVPFPAPERQNELFDTIERLYKEQRIGQGVEWCIDYNTSRGGLIF